jgi:hypothetical protein
MNRSILLLAYFIIGLLCGGCWRGADIDAEDDTELDTDEDADDIHSDTDTDTAEKELSTTTDTKRPRVDEVDADELTGDEVVPAVSWVRIEAGTFLYGSPDDNPAPCSTPGEKQVPVTLTRPFDAEEGVWICLRDRTIC